MQEANHRPCETCFTLLYLLASHVTVLLLLKISEVIPQGLFAATPDFPILVLRVSNESLKDNRFFSIALNSFLSSYNRGPGSPSVLKEFWLGHPHFRVRLGFSF